METVQTHNMDANGKQVICQKQGWKPTAKLLQDFLEPSQDVPKGLNTNSVHVSKNFFGGELRILIAAESLISTVGQV